ncbi:MAG: hypothetical protein ABEI13_03845, partial [Candidatus Paceibacteria bacterium]
FLLLRAIDICVLKPYSYVRRLNIRKHMYSHKKVNLLSNETSSFWIKRRIYGRSFWVKIDSFTQQEIDRQLADY